MYPHSRLHALASASLEIFDAVIHSAVSQAFNFILQIYVGREPWISSKSMIQEGMITCSGSCAKMTTNLICLGAGALRPLFTISIWRGCSKCVQLRPAHILQSCNLFSWRSMRNGSPKSVQGAVSPRHTALCAVARAHESTATTPRITFIARSFIEPRTQTPSQLV